MKTLRPYLLESLLDPQEADAYFEALCEPDVPVSEFLKAVRPFDSVFSIKGFPVRAFAALMHKKTNAWYWMILSDRIGRCGFYRQSRKEVVADLSFTFDRGDYRLPKEERKIEIPESSFLPEVIKEQFENVLTKRFYAKFPFN